MSWDRMDREQSRVYFTSNDDSDEDESGCLSDVVEDVNITGNQSHELFSSPEGNAPTNPEEEDSENDPDIIRQYPHGAYPQRQLNWETPDVWFETYCGMYFRESYLPTIQHAMNIFHNIYQTASMQAYEPPPDVYDSKVLALWRAIDKYWLFSAPQRCVISWEQIEKPTNIPASYRIALGWMVAVINCVGVRHEETLMAQFELQKSLNILERDIRWGIMQESDYASDTNLEVARDIKKRDRMTRRELARQEANLAKLSGMIPILIPEDKEDNISAAVEETEDATWQREAWAPINGSRIPDGNIMSNDSGWTIEDTKKQDDYDAPLEANLRRDPHSGWTINYFHLALEGNSSLWGPVAKTTESLITSLIESTQEATAKKASVHVKVPPSPEDSVSEESTSEE
ncbi:hypothetical protein EDC01DRAFT_781441 [Geopyxis carbonaria]|nr:hypothetical protein EDC01DRAFT_781441 [Geopyxis carbonaria]